MSEILGQEASQLSHEEVNELKRQAWEEGTLDWKLREHQQKLYRFLADQEEYSVRTFLRKVSKCARRFGKTFTVLTVVNEYAQKFPGIRMRYAAPTEKSLKSYVKPNMRIILSDCPRDLKPRWVTQESMYLWPNGSELWLAGTDKEHAEKLRGPGTDFGVIDEAGSMNNMKYVLNDILLPGTLDNDGRIVVISTPAKTPGHDFTMLVNEAEGEGSLLIQTVYDNSWLMSRPDKLQEYIDASGGKESSTWKREYECQDVVDEAIATIPEGADQELMKQVVYEYERPRYFNSITSMDPGFSPSHTGILFGYVDFKGGFLYIEDELDMMRMRTDIMAAKIAKREEELGYGKKPHGRHVRWSDIDPRLLQDLEALHGLSFAATSKDLLTAMVNHARVLLSQKKIRIHPRCKMLLAELRSVVWNDAKTGFEFSTAFGHYDLISALIYMTRNADWQGNPYPILGDDVSYYTHIIDPNSYKPRGNEGLLAHIFKVAKSARIRPLHGR